MIKIALVGPACSGKTSAYEYIKKLCDEKNIYLLKFAQPHYDVLAILHQEKHRPFLQEFSDLAKEHFGEDIFVKIFEEKVNDISQDNIGILICDDLRYLIEYDSCYFYDWNFIYIDAHESIRKERSDKLGLKWNPKHNSEQCHVFKDKCAIQIENNDLLDDFLNKIESVFHNIINQ